MHGSLSPPVSLRARGPLAVFTDVALKVERVTVPVMTPSAARGLLSAVLWKPAIEWCIERIKVLAPIRFTSFRRNEVNSRVPSLAGALVREGGEAPVLYADEDRAQRNTVALRDVDYIVEARFVLTHRAGTEDTIRKFMNMFQRRVSKGQCFTQPYLGCREFPADISPADGAPPPWKDSRRLGRILWDVEYSPGRKPRPHFFEAELVDGVLEVPMPPTIRALVRS